MPPIEIHGLHALTHPVQHGGIPIGIAFDDHGNLAPEARRRLAAQSGLPNILFVSRSVVADFQIDCWSTTQQASTSPTDVVGVMGLLQARNMLPRRYVAFASSLGITTATVIAGTPVIEHRPKAIHVTRASAPLTARLGAVLAEIDPILFGAAGLAEAAIVDDFLILPVSDPLASEAISVRDNVIREILVMEGIEGLVGSDVTGVRSGGSCAAKLLISRSLEMLDPLHLVGALARHARAIERPAPTSLTIRQQAHQHSRICHAIAHAASDGLSTSSLLIGGSCKIGPICHFSLSDSAA